MKAVVCKTYGPPESLVYEEVPSKRPGKGQVVISVRAAGVNFPDTLLIAGKYQLKPPMPFSPGIEVAGVVKELGAGVDSVQIGDRVIGLPDQGGFAQEVLVDAARLFSMPQGMEFPIASAFVATYGTAYYALKDRGQLRPGETLLVLGAAGGAGLCAVEIGKILGARVIAAASSEEKLAVCKQQGADELINYATQDLRERVKDLTGGNGVDVVYDPVGGNYSEVALRTIAWGGRFLVIGFTTGDIARIPLNLPLLKGCSIVGIFFWASLTLHEPTLHQENVRGLLSWYMTGKIKPHIGATYPLHRAADALNELLNRQAKGKLVLLVEEG
jgi:NADPH2:quinone reductase